MQLKWNTQNADHDTDDVDFKVVLSNTQARLCTQQEIWGSVLMGAKKFIFSILIIKVTKT